MRMGPSPRGSKHQVAWQRPPNEGHAGMEFELQSSIDPQRIGVHLRDAILQ